MTPDPHAALRSRAEDPALSPCITADEWLQPGPRGWVEPMPGACSCGSERRLIGYVHCLCGGGPMTGGHRTGGCRECSREVVVGHRG